MSPADQARRELVSALNLLMRRRGATSDAVELEHVEAAVDLINEQLQEIGQASLLEAASLAAAAAAALEAVVADARTGAFEAFIGQARTQIGRLRAIAAAAPARPMAAARRGGAKPVPRKPATTGKKAMKKTPAKTPAAKKRPAPRTRAAAPSRKRAARPAARRR